MNIFLFAGEASGDLHGAPLVKALKKMHPTARIWGVGGPRMREEGLETIMETEKFSVMGFVDVFLALPRLVRQFFFLRNLLLKKKPDIAFFIDYPGFNLAMAKSLKKRKFPGKICQYICPSVWAWNKGRISKMEQCLDELYTILPFEPELFDPKKLTATFVGHPLVQERANSHSNMVALFPGSREKEITRNLEIQLVAAKKLSEEFPDLAFGISACREEFESAIVAALEKIGMQATLFPAEKTGELMGKARLAIAKSGTITLELALRGVPTVVTYGIGPLDLLIARNILRINLPHYCIVNIIAGKTIFPELFGPHLTSDRLYRESKALLISEEKWQNTREKCLKIGTILGSKRPEEEIPVLLWTNNN